MRHRIQTVFIEITTYLLLGTALMAPITHVSAADTPSDNFCHNGFAPDGSCRKTEPDDIKALHIVTQYCDILPDRDLRMVPLNPSLSDKQALQARLDAFNGTERKLATLRQKLMKLNRADVEKILHSQFDGQDHDPNNAPALECPLEIAARIFPHEYDDYVKLIEPGVDTTGLAQSVKDRFLGKDAAMHENAKDIE